MLHLLTCSMFQQVLGQETKQSAQSEDQAVPPIPSRERALWCQRHHSSLGNGNCNPGGNQSCRAQLGWQGLQPQRSPGLELLQSMKSVVWLIPHISPRVYQCLPIEICMTSSKSGFCHYGFLKEKYPKGLSNDGSSKNISECSLTIPQTSWDC